jgi:hypothetical protein
MKNLVHIHIGLGRSPKETKTASRSISSGGPVPEKGHI